MMSSSNREQFFIQALLSKAVFCQRFSFFTAYLVNYLHKVLPWWKPKGRFLKFRSPRVFPALFLTAEA